MNAPDHMSKMVQKTLALPGASTHETAITERFGRLGRIALHKYRVRVGQAHHEEVDLAFYAANHAQGLTKPLGDCYAFTCRSVNQLAHGPGDATTAQTPLW